MKKLLSLLAISFIVLSCSSDETSTPVAPPSAPIAKYTISFSAGDGGTVSTTGGEYEEGQTVSVTATPQGEYLFIGWSDGNTDATRTITVDATKTLTANFEKKKYPLTVNIEGEGEVLEEIVNAGRTTDYDSGTTVKLTAVPADGWEFVGWTGAIESTELEVQLLISEAKEVDTQFGALPTYTVTTQDITGGIVQGEFGDFYLGKELTYIAESKEGYVFIGWEGYEESSNVLTIILEESTLILPIFEAKPFDVLTMDEIKYGVFTKDISNGKQIVDLETFHFPYLNWNFNEINVNEDLDFLASENFIVYWDKRYDHNEYAIDVLRWSEFGAVKAIQTGHEKPKDFDTHRVNIFIFRNDEFGEDVFEPDFGQAAHGDSNGRSFITYPFYNNFFQGSLKRDYPTMDVLHETYHIFQNTNNYLFDNRRWYRESTAEYFQSIFVADKRPSTLRHIPHFLQSTYLKLWKSYGSSPDELQHLYGLQLLFHYLDWESDIDLSFLGNSWNDSNTNETPLEYLLRKIPEFENKYFDFALKSTVIDFPYWVDEIKNQNINLNNSNYWIAGQRHELELQDEGTNGNYESENKIQSWGFSSIKLNSTTNASYDIVFSSNYDSYRLGIVKEFDNSYEYSEIQKTSSIETTPGQTVYLVIVNITDDFNSDSDYPYLINIAKN